MEEASAPPQVEPAQLVEIKIIMQENPDKSGGRNHRNAPVFQG